MTIFTIMNTSIARLEHQRCVPIRLQGWILLCALSLTSTLYAQEKWERETRLSPADVPMKALDFLGEIPQNTRIKWYREASEQGITLEAKFRYNKQFFSVEFDSIGKFQDLEIERDWKELGPETQASIHVKLAAECADFKVVRLQQQWSDSMNRYADLHTLLDSKEPATHVEVVARCKNNTSATLYEYLFTRAGSLVRKSRLIGRASSHLEF